MPYPVEEIKKKQEAARLAWARATEINDSVDSKIGMTPEQEDAWNKANSDMDRYLAEADRMQKLNDKESLFSSEKETPPQTTMLADHKPHGKELYAHEKYHEAFTGFLRTGDHDAMKRELWTALQVDSPLYGGYLVASERFVNDTIIAADQTNVVSGMIRTFQCGYEETLGAPSLDTDISNFTFTGETTEAETDQIVVGRRELKPKPLKPKIVQLSKFLLESPRYDTEALVTGRLGMALGRTFEYYYLVGNGANQPLGLFTASNDGISTSYDVSTGNTSSSPTFDGLINAEGALPQKYRPTARYLFHQDAETKLRLLKDGESRYIWQMGNVTAGLPNTILGRGYVLSQYCPNTFTTGQYVGILGDFSYYWAAVTMDTLRIQRLVEKYAEYDLIGLKTERIAFDGMPVLGEAFIRIKLG